MRRAIRWTSLGAAAGLTVLWGSIAAVAQTMVTFQHGANGYNDGQDIRISMDPARDGTDGNTATDYLIDGWTGDDPDTEPIENSPDEQELIRFSNIFGNGPGQIPLGATILDAQLTYRTFTGSASTSPSPGPFGVAGLLQPFTTATRHADFPSSNGNPLLPSRGPWFEDGYATRPVGAFGGLSAAQNDGVNATGTRVLGGFTDADVWPLVQRWSDGETNHGFVVQAGWTGQTNGWRFFTNGAVDVPNRPKLSVTYTEDPIGITTFQRDLNGYTGDMVARLDSGGDLNNSSDDVTLDGSTASGAYYIDGATGAGGQFNALLKFNNVFGAGANQAPDDKPVEKAWLVVTTGLGDDNRSPGPFSLHPMLRPWDTNSLFTNFGATPGFQQADGDIGPALDTNFAAVNGGESWFDITDYMEDVRTGVVAEDLGFALLPKPADDSLPITGDGWAIHLNGHNDAALRPRLVIYSNLSEAPGGTPGDYNDDGSVDAADYVTWRKGIAPLANDDTPGNQPGDYDVWRANFGAVTPGSGGAVPEPASIAIVLVVLFTVAIGSARDRNSRF